jgi:D-alanine-D-alanine ligase
VPDEGAAKRRVLLLYGGRSAEHDVSRVTAVAVARALDPERYEVVPVAITTDGRWLLAESAQRAIAAGPTALPSAFDVDGAVAPAVGALEVDVVFPLLHGPYGEDGTVQGLLELADLPYVGSGVVGSAVGMDKIAMKRAFTAVGLPYARTVDFRDGHDRAALAERVERELGYPCFVKPANLGSSVGVSKARDRAGFEEAVDLALAYDEWIVVEEAITGREIELGVLGDDPPTVSVAGEIVPGDDFYSYADKYEADDAELLVPAPITDAQLATAQALACRAFEACRLEAMARVDLFLADDPAIGDGGFLVNEVNTIPGFTPISMYPRLWEASGVPYPELLDRLVDLALARHARRAARAGKQR